MEFLHVNELKQQYASKFGYKFTFLIVLSASQNDLEIVVSTEELNRLKNADELIQVIMKRQKTIKTSCTFLSGCDFFKVFRTY